MRLTRHSLICACFGLAWSIGAVAQDDIEVGDSTSVDWGDGTGGGFVVNLQAPVTIKADDKTMVYGDACPELTYNTEGAALDGTPSLTCEATPTSPVGEYPIIVSKGSVSNYNVTYVAGTLTVTKAPLTVKAVDATMHDGDDLPLLTLTYEGWKNGEDESVLTEKPVATTAATPESAQGECPIAVSGGQAVNYSFVYVDGVLTILESADINAPTAAVGGKLVVCDLQGRRLLHPSKGLYVVNGRKVLVR